MLVPDVVCWYSCALLRDLAYARVGLICRSWSLSPHRLSQLAHLRVRLTQYDYTRHPTNRGFVSLRSRRRSATTDPVEAERGGALMFAGNVLHHANAMQCYAMQFSLLRNLGKLTAFLLSAKWRWILAAGALQRLA